MKKFLIIFSTLFIIFLFGKNTVSCFNIKSNDFPYSLKAGKASEIFEQIFNSYLLSLSNNDVDFDILKKDKLLSVRIIFQYTDSDNKNHFKTINNYTDDTLLDANDKINIFVSIRPLDKNFIFKYRKSYFFTATIMPKSSKS